LRRTVRANKIKPNPNPVNIPAATFLIRKPIPKPSKTPPGINKEPAF